MEQDKLPHIFTKFRKADSNVIESGYIKSQLKSAINMVTSSYGVLDVYGEKRGEIQQKIQDEFAKMLAVDGIIIESFNFGEIRPDTQSMAAIQAKVDAQQKLQQYETEKQQATILAEKARIEAKGKADAKVIEAEGTAKANRLLAGSMTPELIQYTWVNKWNGATPAVQGAGGVMMNMPIPTPAAEEKK